MLRSLILSLVLFSSAALAAPIDDALKSYDQGDFAQAAKLLPDLAKAGDARAQYSLAVMYFYGRGLPEDEKLALEWARKSAEQGNLDICLGYCDAQNKRMGFGPVIHLTGDVRADMDIIRDFYSDVRGVNPDRATPPRLREEDEHSENQPAPAEPAQNQPAPNGPAHNQPGAT